VVAGRERQDPCEDLPLTVAICTFARPEPLRWALDCLVAEVADPQCYEVLVIDNGPGSDTEAVVRSFEGRLPWLHHVVELEQGINHARRRARREARGAIIGYLDDDALAPPGRVASVLDAFDRWGEGLGSAGGPVISAQAGPRRAGERPAP
jgi:glycosyltransferase involved in cell wall biosynthesis